MTMSFSLSHSINRYHNFQSRLASLTFANLNEMKYPLFFYVAFVLGIHTHSGTKSKPYFLTCAFVTLTFLLFNNFKSVYDLFSLKIDSFIVMLVFYRAFIGPYFVIAGLLDYKSVEINCARILKEITVANRKLVQRKLLIYFVFMISIGLPDIYIRACISATNGLDWVLVFLTGLVSRSVCMVTVMKFMLVCEIMQTSYRQLKDDVTNTYPRLAAFTMSRLRARHLEICELEKNVKDALGLRLFIFILMLQLGVLEKSHILIDEFALGKYGFKMVEHLYTLSDFLVTVLVLSSFTWNTSVKVFIIFVSKFLKKHISV